MCYVEGASGTWLGTTAIETCVCFSLVLTEHTFKPQQQQSEGHSLAHLHFTGRLVSRYLCSVQRAGRSKSFSTLLKSAPKFPSQQRERRPWSAPLPKTCRTTRCPRQPVTAPISHLLFSERVDSDRFRPGRLRHLTVSPNASIQCSVRPHGKLHACFLSPFLWVLCWTLNHAAPLKCRVAF